jgi:cytochrome c oxidase subunit 3
VLGGVVGLAVILSRGMAGQFTRRHHVAVEAVHYYWHFVDVVWVLLFSVLYVLK